MSVAQADKYQTQLEGFADLTSRRLLRIWDVSTLASEDAWIASARPLLGAAANRAIALSVTYANTTAPQFATGQVSRLIAPATAARVHDPMLVVAEYLSEGMQWGEATRAARPVVDSLGSDAVMGAGRDAVADRLPEVGQFVRRLNQGACKWCLSLSGVVWDTAHEATFGHTKCKCVATPLADLGDHNDMARQAAGWDDQAAASYKKRAQISRLRKSEQTAKRRSREAAAEARKELDPARLERLSIREQDWETRAERAAEKRRILETGTHRLAA